MQIYANKLAAQLSKTLSPIYLVAGDDMLLRNDACELIRNTALKQGFDERERHNHDSNFDWNSWSDSCNALSLFASKRLIELRLSSSKIGTEGSKAISQYIENPAPDCILLIISPRIEGKPKWFNGIVAKGAYVPIYALDTNQLPQWLIQRAKQNKLVLTSDAAELLAERVTGNLMAAAQELEKLSLSHTPNSTIDAEAIEKAVSSSARYTVFNMLDLAVNGEAKNACRALRHLREEGTEAVATIAAIAHQLRNLLLLKGYQQQGGLDSGFKTLRIFAKKQPSVRNALKRLSAEQLEDCVQLASRADIMSKSGQRGTSWSVIEMILLALSGHSLPTQHFILNDNYQG